MAAITIVFIIIGVIVGLGWLPLLIAGCVSLFKKRMTSGLIMTILGGIWGVFSLIFIAIGIVAFSAYQKVEGMSKIETYNPEMYKGETGTMKLTGWQEQTELILKDASSKKLKLISANGTFQPPAGNYSVYSIKLEKKGNNNKIWRAYINPGTWRKPYKVNIQKDSPAELKVGEPFSAQINAQQKSGNKIQFSMNISDCGNNKTSIYVSGRKKPEVQLLDASGKAIWNKALEYG